MTWLLYLLAAAAGIVSTAFSGSNATLSRTLGQPITAGIIVEAIALTGLVAVGFTYGGMGWPAGKFAALPWWAWLGGLGTVSILTAQLTLASRIGAAPYTAITVSAGLVVSILLDQFGWLGFEQHTAHWPRLVGGVLMISGVILVTRN